MNDNRLMPTVATEHRVHRFTTEEYFRMLDAGILSEDDRVELIDGHLTDMSPQNKPHRVALGKIVRRLAEVLGDQYWVQPQSSLPLDEADCPEPDVAVLPGQPDDLIAGEPSTVPLIIEIADTSLGFDRGDKLRLYARHAVSRYWIVDLAHRVVHVYTEPSGETYRMRRSFEPGEAVPLAFIDVDISVEDCLPPSE